MAVSGQQPVFPPEPDALLDLPEPAPGVIRLDALVLQGLGSMALKRLFLCRQNKGGNLLVFSSVS